MWTRDSDLKTLEKFEAPFKLGNFIGGSWIPGSGTACTVISPLDGNFLGEFHFSTNEDLKAAVAKAKESFGAWSATPLKERTQVMFNFRDILKDNIDEISRIVHLENGKTIPEARAGVMKGLEVLEFALSIQNMDSQAKMEVSRGVSCEYIREPLGVVASITPFNFPAMVPMWTMPIALTLGNCYIWKPSEKTPLTSYWMACALKEAGLPDGVLSVVQGGKEVVEGICEHPDIKAVGFVGSTKVAKLVYAKAASTGKRALCLGGAKNHLILLPDAEVKLSGMGIADSFTGCAGQRCMAASVLLAVGDVDHIIEKVVERARATKIGEQMGAVIDSSSVERITKAIDRAESEGVKVLLDGRNPVAPKGCEKGSWLSPTILDGVKPGSEFACDELFGPVISIIRVNSLSEALEIENSNPYGNACSVFTSSGIFAQRVAKEARAGMVGVNIGVPVPREPFSFAGINDSKFGAGEITGEASMDFWSNLKKLTTKWELQSDNNWMS